MMLPPQQHNLNSITTENYYVITVSFDDSESIIPTTNYPNPCGLSVLAYIRSFAYTFCAE